jgi:phage baseplate assembly protein W
MSDPLVGRGWPFPLRVAARGVGLVGGDDKIRQSLWILLSTSRGERLMRPAYGCGLRELLFEPNTATLRGMVADRIREAVLRFEPRIDLVAVTVESASEGADVLLIRLDYRVRATNAFYNLVYPFFLTEGPAAPAERLLERPLEGAA